MKPNVKSNCARCNKYFERYVLPYRLRRGHGKYCSAACSNKVGHPHTQEARQKIRESKIGDKNPQYGLREEKSQHWKGDGVGYFGVHDWMTRQYGQPIGCELCGDNRTATRYEWANISGKYYRDRNDFMRLCKKCHNNYDGVNAWQNYKRAKNHV